MSNWRSVCRHLLGNSHTAAPQTQSTKRCLLLVRCGLSREFLCALFNIPIWRNAANSLLASEFCNRKLRFDSWVASCVFLPLQMFLNEKIQTWETGMIEFPELWKQKHGTIDRNGRMLWVLRSESAIHVRALPIKQSYKPQFKERENKCAVCNRILLCYLLVSASSNDVPRYCLTWRTLSHWISKARVKISRKYSGKEKSPSRPQSFHILYDRSI